MRLYFAIILLCVAPACTPVVKPMSAAINGPSISGNALIARDGAILPLKTWLPDKKPQVVIVALHGFNHYSNAIAMPAGYWAKRGIATYAYDQRGFGGAPNRGYWPGLRTLISDFHDAIKVVAARHKGIPIFVMGVSMGGAVVMAALAQNPIEGIEGALLIAPAVWGRNQMNVIQRGALWFLSNTMPWLTVTGQGLNIKPSDNMKMLRGLSRDTKLIRHTRIDAIKGLVDLMDTAFAAAPKLGQTPLFIAYGLKDEIIPRKPTIDVMRRLPANSATRRALYKTGYHLILRDTKAKLLWRDVATWIRDKSKSLLSGADKRAESLLSD